MPELRSTTDHAETCNRTELLLFASDFVPNLDRNDPAFRVAAVLMASLLECGPDPEAIAELLGYEASWVRTVGGRFRAAGVWKGDAVAVEGPAGSAYFSYRSWRRAVRAGVGTSEQGGDEPPGATSRRGPRRPDGGALQLDRHSLASERSGRHG